MVIVSVASQVPVVEVHARRADVVHDRVPDVVPDRVPDVESVTFMLDGVDECGVEQALRTREAGIDAELVALGCGLEGNDQVVRTALGLVLADELGWPHVDWAIEFRLEGVAFEVAHDVDDGTERVHGDLRVVIRTQSALNEPRYPTLPNTVKARRTPLGTRASCSTRCAGDGREAAT